MVHGIFRNLTFKNNVSGTGFTVDGNTVVNTGVINTTGNQTYNGTVTLDQAAVLTARTTDAPPVNQTITFKGNVSSSADITLEADVSIGAAEITLASDTQIKLAGDISGSGKTLTLNAPVFNSTLVKAVQEVQEMHILDITLQMEMKFTFMEM